MVSNKKLTAEPAKLIMLRNPLGRHVPMWDDTPEAELAFEKEHGWSVSKKPLPECPSREEVAAIRADIIASRERSAALAAALIHGVPAAAGNGAGATFTKKEVKELIAEALKAAGLEAAAPAGKGKGKGKGKDAPPGDD